MDQAAALKEQIARALRRAWHPVARVQDLERPQPATLLGEDLVVFRAAGGKPAVSSNRCPHRGAGLHLGWAEGNAIVCPYHGWQWRADDGACVRIPSQPSEASIPSNVVLKTYPAVEHWGLVWTCLDSPAVDLPRFPELDGIEWSFMTGEIIPAPAGIAAVTENFRDVAHFPFVHRQTMGEIAEVVEPLKVRRQGIEVWLERHYHAENGPDEDIWNDLMFYYHVVAPGTVIITFDYGPNGKRYLIQALSPVGPEDTIIYWIEGIGADFRGRSLEECTRSEYAVYLEDVPILRSLRPREVPFGENIEFSTAADRYTLAYRRAFLEFVRLAGTTSGDGAAVESAAAVVEASLA